MLLVWVAFIVLFFTKSNSKLPGYILPVFPGVALLVAHYLDGGTRRGRMVTAGLTALMGIALLVTVPFMQKLAKHAGEDVLYAAYQPWVLAAGLVLLIGGCLALLYARQMLRDLFVVVLAVAGFAGTELMLVGFEPIGQVRAGVNLLPALKAAGAADPAVKVYSVGIYEQSLTFYLRRPVTLVDYRDEFDFGLQQQPELAIPDIPTFVGKWRADAAAGRRTVAITRPEIAAELKRQGVPLRIVAADARRTVIATL
jgi:4-amino-4-deoxy-L-arabinose transferase-like glycosyltransferase